MRLGRELEFWKVGGGFWIIRGCGGASEEILVFKVGFCLGMAVKKSNLIGPLDPGVFRCL